MFGKRFERQRPGRAISARSLNRPRKALERFLGLHVASPLNLQWFDGQPMIWLDTEETAGFCMTPSGGIAAATQTGSPATYTFGKAACVPYQLDDTGTCAADPGTDTITAYNPLPVAVAGSKLVMYVYVNDLPIVMLEPC